MRHNNTKMNLAQTGYRALYLHLLFFMMVGSGCATLPDVDATIRDASASGESAQIVSARGLLTPKQSKALVERLKKSGSTDVLEVDSAVIESLSDSPLTKDNKVSLLIDGVATYTAYFKAIDAATDHINIEMYILEEIEDESGRKLSDVLLKKQAEGVQVNIIYDSKGSLSTPPEFFKKLKDGGVQTVEFNPINPIKSHGKWRLAKADHRKIFIVDGKFGITGGINISKVYSSGASSGSGPSSGQQNEQKDAKQLPWRDTDIQIEGPAVAEMQKLFLDTWEKESGKPLTGKNYFPDLKGEGNALVRIVASSAGQENRLTFIMYVTAITFSEKSLHMTNAYFVPDKQTLSAITDAAKRGVDVRIILPSTTDSKVVQFAAQYYYSELLKSGVKLYLRRNAILHAKTLVIDDVWSTVGSTNMDFWSFSSNDEINAVVLNRPFAAEMEKMFAQDIAASEEITWDKWKKRPFVQMVKEWGAHLFARWL
jgi:cardiolipin synthase A/B